MWVYSDPYFAKMIQTDKFQNLKICAIKKKKEKKSDECILTYSSNIKLAQQKKKKKGSLYPCQTHF